MITKDTNKLRSLFALRGLHRQVDIAETLKMSQNSVVRLFQGKPVHRSTAYQIAGVLGADVNELFCVPKDNAVVEMM